MTEPGMPDCISVSETQQYELVADRADLFVTVAGSSLFASQEALKKAREVALLVGELTAYGLPSEAIFLEGVSADTQTGTLTKNSMARYRLRLHCADLSQLADLIGIITSQKNSSLTAIEWGYDDDDAQRDTWLLACVARVNEKAAKLAAALGVRLQGVHSLNQQFHDPEVALQIQPLSEPSATMRRSRVTKEELGLEISHTKKLQVTVSIKFRISDYATVQ